MRIFFYWIIMMPLLADAANTLREQRIAEELKQQIVIGEVKMLEAKGTEFFTLYTKSEVDKQQGVILIHGMGAHPDWIDVIHPLRTQLPEHGWSTLSIQAPILSTTADFADYVAILDEISPRIEAAIEFYKSEETRSIMLVGHSFGAVMASFYAASVAEKKDSPLIGLVAISLSGREIQDFNPLDDIEKIKLPMLDLYGGFDLPEVKNTMRAKKSAAIRGENTAYRQSEIPFAGHFYRNTEDILVKKVRTWMTAQSR